MYRRLVLMVTLLSLLMVLIACAGFDGGRASQKSSDYVGAHEELKALAEQGNAVVQHNLEVMYRKGQGVPKDQAVAEERLRKAIVQRSADPSVRSTEIRLQKRGGVYELPVKINGVISLNFILDTGASEVSIPADVALTLLRTGTITQGDFLPGQFYQLADGSTVGSSRFILRELDLGDIKITQVPASIASATAPLLLGQSFLGRLGSWEMDNKRHVLFIRGVK